MLLSVTSCSTFHQLSNISPGSIEENIKVNGQSKTVYVRGTIKDFRLEEIVTDSTSIRGVLNETKIPFYSFISNNKKTKKISNDREIEESIHIYPKRHIRISPSETGYVVIPFADINKVELIELEKNRTFISKTIGWSTVGFFVYGFIRTIQDPPVRLNLHF